MSFIGNDVEKRSVKLLCAAAALMLAATLSACGEKPEPATAGNDSGGGSTASSQDVTSDEKESQVVSDSTGEASSAQIGEESLHAETKDELVAQLESYPDSFSSRTGAQLKDAYTVSIEGDSYVLPCSLQDFLDNGWSTNVDDYEGGTVSYYEMPDEMPSADEYAQFTIFKGDKTLELSVTSANGATTMEDCAVFMLDFSYFGDSKTPDFELSSGIGPASTLQDILETYGCPYAPESCISKRSEDDYRLVSLKYSRSEYEMKLAAEAKEAAKEAAREEAKENGEILIDTEPVSANGTKIFSKPLGYDSLTFEFSGDAGELTGIELFNTAF